jgi:hypothetical protein
LRQRFGQALLLGALFAGEPACRKPEATSEASATPSAMAASPQDLAPRSARPVSTEAVAVARRVQGDQLQLEPQRQREPRLAFGRGALGQLTEEELRVLDSSSGELRLRQPLEGARLVVPLVDGTLLAVGAKSMLRVDPQTKKLTHLGKPVLLPAAELYPDAVAADRVWVFDVLKGSDGRSRPMLNSIALEPPRLGILLPERSVELEQPPGGLLGRTREGVFLYLGESGAERFAPGGARLSKPAFPSLPRVVWVLPARRLDQCFLFERGRVLRAVVSPSFKQLAAVELAGTLLTAAVGDEGRLLAAVVVTGAGPRFELQLFDEDLAQLARVALPSEEPTGGKDWVKVVTENQGLAVAPREGRLAVGGPGRLQVLDASAKLIFSIPSR